ncbi:RimK/LysX family protein [Desulfurivibrio sp. D14AmB]|uniref:ATP-dependent zinc protease family protein n=1 Tax=Desulfurivibrio sp. D14AmB TaxID=3374370 RepID=UPI00376EFE31
MLTAGSLLLAGCGALLVEKESLERLDRLTTAQEQRLESLGSTQDEILGALLNSHHEVAEKLDEVTVQLAGVAGQQAEMLERQREWQEFIRNTRGQERADREDLAIMLPPSLQTPGGKQLVGAVEKVFLSPPGVLFSARIDTGATTSSLDVHEVERFERDGEGWVRFTLSNPEDESRVTLERKVVRNARIIQAVTEEAERRPVVELGVTLGENTQTAEFTLSDRRHLEHPVLIGRNILLDIMVVDVGRTNIAPPRLPTGFPDPADVEATP